MKRRKQKPSKALAAIVGKEPLERTEALRRLIEHIERVQQTGKPTRSGAVRLDAKLERLFGGEVSLLQLPLIVARNLSD